MGLASLMERLFSTRRQLDPQRFRRAKPLRNPLIREEPIAGGLRLIAPIAEVSRGWKARLARRSKTPLEKTFELEEFGAFVWAKCDGKHTVEGIGRGLREQFGLNRLEAEAALTAFLQTLAQRGLITLLVPEARHEGKRS